MSPLGARAGPCHRWHTKASSWSQLLMRPAVGGIVIVAAAVVVMWGGGVSLFSSVAKIDPPTGTWAPGHDPCVPAPPPVEIGRLEPSTALRRAELTQVAHGFVVAGMESAGPGWSTTPGGGPGLGAPRVWAPDGSLLPLPGDSLSIAQTSVLAPIALDEDRWAIVWGESAPGPGGEGIPADQAVTHLRVAEWTNGHWTQARVLAEGGFVDWNRTGVVRRHRALGTFAMVTAHETPIVGQAAALLFGGIEERLAPIPLPHHPRPLLGSFDVSESGDIVLIAIARGPGEADDPFEVLFLTSENEGRAWSEPLPVHSVPRDGFFPSNLHVRIDGEGRTHVLWSEYEDRDLHADVIRHYVRPHGEARWETSSIQLQAGTRGIVASWVAGIDRRGRLTLANEILEPPRTLTIETRRWFDGQWSEPRRPLPDMITSAVFSGQGWDGSWHVGWSGGEIFAGWDPQTGEEPPPFSVWVLSP